MSMIECGVLWSRVSECATIDAFGMVTSTALVVDVVEEGRDTLKACRLLTGFWGAGMFARVRLRTRFCTQLPLLQLSPENPSRIPFF